MTIAKKKGIEDYFQQVDLIKIADDKAIAAGEVYKLVAAQRAEHDTVGDDFQAKTIAVAQHDAAYDLKVKEKQAFDKAVEDSSRKLMLWVDAAYRAESERINRTLLLDLKYPADDEKAYKYLEQVLDALKNYDDQGGTYPLDPAFVNTFTTDANGFITTLVECVDMLEDRQSKIQDRDDALSTYIEVTEDIRFWLYKMLPFKREDKTLKDYGFTPYGTHHADLHTPKDFAYDEETEKFTWDTVEKAEGYEVDFRLTGASGKWTNMYEGADNHTDKKPPDPGEYDFRVRAVAEDKQGNWSGVISVNFNGGALPAPVNFKFDDAKQEFTWDFMELALLYQLEISRDQGQTYVQKYFDVDTWFNAGHLDTGKALARVRALDGYQEPGDWTEPLEVTFKLLAPSFVAYSQYKNEFVWDWVPLATRYELEISPDGMNWTMLYDGPLNHVVLLVDKGEWKVRVRAIRDEQPEVFSEWSKAVPVNIVFGAPADLCYKEVEKRIEWDKVTDAKQYQLMNESRTVNYIGTDNHLDIELAGAEKFRVRAGDGTMEVWGEWTEWTMLG